MGERKGRTSGGGGSLFDGQQKLSYRAREPDMNRVHEQAEREHWIHLMQDHNQEPFIATYATHRKYLTPPRCGWLTREGGLYNGAQWWICNAGTGKQWCHLDHESTYRNIRVDPGLDSASPPAVISLCTTNLQPHHTKDEEEEPTTAHQ
ncbi:uncharacterized protein AB9W97_005748 [Spinachia spinachia]